MNDGGVLLRTSARSRTRWAPTFVQSLKLALRPMLAYFVFTTTAFLAFILTLAFYERGSGEWLEIGLACFAGMVGILAGQLVAILRARTLPIFVIGGISIFFGSMLLGLGAMNGVPIPKEIVPALFFFAFAFPCGMLSLQHRWELFASFWPSVGWIGSVFIILNSEGRVVEWEKDKVSAWMPVPLALLGGFLVFWLFYLAAKQSMRVELWQALSGAASRRVTKKATVGALPRKNVLPLLVTAILLFVATALLAPYLWRTGRGDREGHHQQQQTEQQPEEGPPRRPKFDGEALAKQLRQMAEAAKDTALHLWPLLILFLLYRPAKRALLRTHLLRPLVPTPPTERIENLWEYVRIAAEDAGTVPVAADSVEELIARIRARGLDSKAVDEAAAIYVRTRYGLTVAPGDPAKMRDHAVTAALDLRKNLSTWDKVKNLWRPLS